MVLPAPLQLNFAPIQSDYWWTLERGIDNPNMDSSPYQSDCTDHFTTAQEKRSIFRTLRGVYFFPK
jgi:hypothetical protein